MSCTIPELPRLRGRRQLAWTRYLEGRAKHDERYRLGISSSASTPSLRGGDTTPPEITRKEIPRHEFSCKPRALVGAVGRSRLRDAQVAGKSLSSSAPCLRKSERLRCTSAGGWFGDMSIHSTRRRALLEANRLKSASSTRGGSEGTRTPLTTLSEPLSPHLISSSGEHSQDLQMASRGGLSMNELADSIYRKQKQKPIDEAFESISPVLKTAPPLNVELEMEVEAQFQGIVRSPRLDTANNGDSISNPVITILQPRSPSFTDAMRLASEQDRILAREIPKSLKVDFANVALKAEVLQPPPKPKPRRSFQQSGVSRQNTDPEHRSRQNTDADQESSASSDEASAVSFRSDQCLSDDESSIGSSPRASFRRDPIESGLPAWYPNALSDSEEEHEDVRFIVESPMVESVGPGKIVVRWKVPQEAHCETIWCVRVRQVGDDDWYFVDMDSGRITSDKRRGDCGDLISWKDHALIAQRGVRVLSYAAVEGDKSGHPYFGTIVAHYPGLVVIDFDPVVAELHVEDWRQIVPQDWVVLAANKPTMGQILSELLEKQKRQEHDKSKALWSIARANVYDSIVRARRHCTMVWNFWTPHVDTTSSRILASCAMKSDDTHVLYTSWPVVFEGETKIDAKNMDWPTELCCSDTVCATLEPYPRVQIIPKRWLCDKFPEAKNASENACVGQSLLAFYNCYASGAHAVADHPEAKQDGDITLVTATSKSLFVKSERAVSCTLMRPFILPEKVIVRVHSASIRSEFDVSLVSIQKVRYGPKLVKNAVIDEWTILRDKDDGSVSILARLKDEGWDTAQVLDEQSKVSCYKPGKKKLTTVTVMKITAYITHYEVVFTSQIPFREHVSPHSLSNSVDERGIRNRLKEPEIVVHDIPDFFSNVEVCVGFSRNSTKEQQHPVWSAPSLPSSVFFEKNSLPVPLGPCFSIIGISVVEATWLLPAEPAVECYRVRFRKFGEAEWSFIDSRGRFREKESALAWRSRLVPLKEGLWVSAFGDYDGRKASTPGAAKVVSCLPNLKGNDSVKVAFQKPATVLCLGAAGSELLQCTQSPQLVDEVQDVPVEWIEAAWLLDNHNFLKGSIITSAIQDQPVTLAPLPDDASLFSISVQSDATVGSLRLGHEEVMPGIKVDIGYFSQVGKGDGRGVMMHKEKKYHTTMQVASLHLHGMQPEGRYEVGVQALTTKGWTDWCHAEFQMPKTALKQEETVDERAKGVLYKSALLPQAFYKEYQKCWLTLEESLSPERFTRVKAAMQNKFNSEQSKLSRWLVDTDGPIRGRNMHISEILAQLKDIVARGADLNYRDQATGRTPLTYACEYSRFTKIGIVDELLELRADPNLTNDLNQSPLLLAAERADTRIVQVLLGYGADINLMSRSGVTPFMAAKPREDMDAVQLENAPIIREMLKAERVDWNVFFERISAAGSHHEKALVFLELAFQGEKDIFEVEPDGSKRISKHDRLRLREQIAEAEEINPEEAQRRAIFCGRELLLPQMQASTDAGGQKPSKACSVFTRYLLSSGVMRFVKDEAHGMATSILDYYEKELRAMRENLRLLPSLTEQGEMFVGVAGKKERKKFMGRQLHQWHAHDHLPWLVERNVVGAFEALVHSRAINEMVDFCYWIGELSAKVHSLGHASRVYVGKWDNRLPALFWGDVYARFLLGEASRTAPIFHDLARSIVKQAGGSITYKEAPNKNYARVSKKQLEYASFGMLVMHVALDHMHECFQKVFRTDLDDCEEFIQEVKYVDSMKGAALVIGSLASEDTIYWTNMAVKEAVSIRGSTPRMSSAPILVVFSPHREFQSDFEKVKSELQASGANAVLLAEFPLDDVMNIRRQMEESYREAYSSLGMAEPCIECVYTIDQLQVLADIRRCRTYNPLDLYCCGGVLDLVRGSIECTTEEEVKLVYDLAIGLKVEEHGAEVVRVKNGFNTPAVGGYCDLKLFLQIAKDCGDSRICHICELQVHLQSFLARKKYTHMPYVIDRGDFDYG